MKNILSIFILTILISCGQSKKNDNLVIGTDIGHFWTAYDEIISTKDSILQYKLLDSLYFKQGTVGLRAMQQARSYTAEDYINSINNYPKFWSSIRDNTMNVDQYASEIALGVEALRNIYPEMKPAKIYFTVGAMLSGGTTLDSLVLIGSEISLTDNKTVTSEFPEFLSHLRAHFDTNPKDHLVFLNVHEYVHTQQKPMVYNNLSMSIREGVAEFVACKALDIVSPNPSIEFGRKNAVRIRNVFEHEMFYSNNDRKWLYGNIPNEFEMRDLGYAVGYQICEGFYNNSKNKQAAIKKMIQLDYNNENEIDSFVAKSNYFSQSLDSLYSEWNNKRPQVVSIKQFNNNSQIVNPSTNLITVEFSESLKTAVGVDFGDLGKDAFPKNDVHGRFWSNDNKSWSIPVELESNKRYQILISNNFRSKDDIPLKPYLIDFKTSSQ